LTPRTRNNVGRIWALVALAVVVAACGGAAASATPAPATPTAPATAFAATASPAAGTQAPITEPPTTTAPITAPPITEPPATEPPVTAAPVTPAPPTSAPSGEPVPPRSGAARVDLAFTKTRDFFADDTKGTCRLTKVNGVTRFWFDATAADYGSLGEHFIVKEVDGKVVIDWVIDATTIAYANNPNIVIKISPNHRKVTLNQDLLPLTTPAGFTAKPQHIKGTITCS
jgi:hypothetical protein